MSAALLDTRPGQVVGIDIGGSKTHAVSLVDGRVATEALAGSANLASVGTFEAERQLDAVLGQLARATGATPIRTICAGAAGVDTLDAELRLRDLIADLVPGATVRIVHDTELILAAAGLDHGIALIAGTGSVAWGRTGAGRAARAGGWGYLLGDEGSGYWIAREAVRHALRLADVGQRPDRLSQQLAADCGLQRPVELIDHFYVSPERRYWAGHARMVFELASDGDAAASAIVDAAADALAGLVGTVATVLAEPPTAGLPSVGLPSVGLPSAEPPSAEPPSAEPPSAEPPSAGLPSAGLPSAGFPSAGFPSAGPRTAEPLTVVLGGGVLVHQPALAARVSVRLAELGLTDVRVLDRDPAHGAARLAAELLVVG